VVVLAGVVLAQVQRARKTGELLDQLSTADAATAVDTMHELKKRGHGVEHALIVKLNSPERKERMRAALLLGEIGRPSRSGPPLLPLLSDDWAPVRRAAAESLGLLHYEGAVHPLLRMAQDTKEEMDTRSIAVRKLSLIAMLGNLERTDRELCATALPALLKGRPALTKDQAKAVRKGRADLAKRSANAALVAQGRRVPLEPKEPEKPKAAPKLAPGALPEEAPPPDNEIELRTDVVLALGLLRTDTAIQPLIDSCDEMTEPAPGVRKAACMAIEDLSDLPRDSVMKVKLGQTLLHTLQDSSPDVRLSACRALARHADFENAGLDGSINERLQYMSAEKTAYGEPGYWIRAAARTACDSRHIVVPKPGEYAAQSSAAAGPEPKTPASAPAS
jgi:HEAT repeat protein